MSSELTKPGGHHHTVVCNTCFKPKLYTELSCDEEGLMTTMCKECRANEKGELKRIERAARAFVYAFREGDAALEFLSLEAALEGRTVDV